MYKFCGNQRIDKFEFNCLNLIGEDDLASIFGNNKMVSEEAKNAKYLKNFKINQLIGWLVANLV